MEAALHPVLSAARRIAGIALITVAVGTSASTSAQQVEIMSNEQQAVTRLHILPEPELKDVYLHCLRESTQRVMGYGEIALCSMVYETLLTRIFAGDFDALLAWSKANSDYTRESNSTASGSR